MAQMSPGVEINEIDLSIVVPALGNSTACFAGVFEKGPSDKYLLITNVEELIRNFGYPTKTNYNEWFQCSNFLQYANKLLVSRAVDSLGTFIDSSSTVSVIDTLTKVTLDSVPTDLVAGSIIKFSGDVSGDEYKVLAIVGNEIELDVDAAFDFSSVISIGAVVSIKDSALNAIVDIPANTYTESTSTVSVIDTDTKVTLDSVPASLVVDSVIKFSGDTSGDEYKVLAIVGNEIELDVDAAFDFSSVISIGAVVSIKDDNLRSAEDLKLDAEFIPNEESYEIKEASVYVHNKTRLKFIAKSSGFEMNGIEVAIAREADFKSGKSYVFEGILLNDLFETTPKDINNEIAVIIRKDDKISGAYLVSLTPGTKDYRNKSIYIEDLINKYDDLLYVKDNTSISELPESRLYNSVIGTTIANVTTYSDDMSRQPLVTSNGSDGEVDEGDIENAYGNVADNTIFGNKEEIDIDIVIANENNRVVAGKLASERADCIAFISSKFEDMVNLKSTIIVEKLIDEVNTGEMNTAETANSFSAYFGGYKYQYDKYNDKYRWVSIAGDVAGLRADTNSQLNTWWASAGIERGQIKNAEKLAFNPNQGQRDLLYKNKINPVVSFPGQGNAIVWGQKTLQSKPSSFDRINVRGLFNTLERAISRMAKHFLFEFNDVYTRNRFVATIKPFLESVQAGRGVYDFYIRCDEDNNTPQVIDNNQFIADIAVKPTRVAEFITLNFVAVGTGVEFSEIFI